MSRQLEPLPRRLDLGQGVLCVVDGAKALRKAIDEVLGPVPEDADLIVHATPARDEVLVRVGAGQTLVDLPYPGSATPPRRPPARRGAIVLDGLDVLVAQGAASFELWTGLPAPVEVMRAAIRR